MSFRFTQDEKAGLTLLRRSRLKPPGGAEWPSPNAEPKAWTWAVEEITLWRQLFGARMEGNLMAAIEAHVVDPDRGQWWPRPADLGRHLPKAQAYTEQTSFADLLEDDTNVVSLAERERLAQRIECERWFHTAASPSDALNRVVDAYKDLGRREGKVIHLASCRTIVPPIHTDGGPKVKGQAELIAWMGREAQ